ncbi:MAG: hypothetical protein HY754_15680 [Nitrospirae bacterium]|nr:hypothetical protein [Nitrospirota bacterium]
MLRQSFTVSSLVLIILINSVFSSAFIASGDSFSTANPPVGELRRTDLPKGGKDKTEYAGPIVITSATLSADNKTHTAMFEGSVVAKSEDMTLYSDRMLVYYAERTGNVTRIDAEGRVKLIKKDLIVTSNEARYFAEEDKVVFTGEPRAVEKGNIVTGTKMTYLLKEDRSIVENSRVLLENKKVK